MSQKMTCYIDESGNTKDAYWGIGKKSSFDDQPYFTLGLVAVNDDKVYDLEKHVLAMKEKFKVKSDELKGTNLYKNNKVYINSILKYLLDIDAVIMCEITDKKYFLASQINNFILNFSLQNGDIIPFLKYFADNLYKIIDDYSYSIFCELCRHRTVENYNCFLNHFENLINQNDFPIDTKIHSFFKTHIKEMVEEQDRYDIYMKFLPSSDMSKKGYTWSSIPNIPALTNLIMRINYYAKKKKIKVKHIKFIHDEEMYLDEIFKSNIKNLYTNLILYDQNEFCDYKKIDSSFADNINIKFDKSVTIVGLQIADIVAGTIINNFYDCIKGKKGKNIIDKNEKIILERMLFLLSNNINYVMPDEVIKKHQSQLLMSSLIN